VAVGSRFGGALGGRGCECLVLVEILVSHLSAENAEGWRTLLPGGGREQQIPRLRSG
jgi:hypothetical protein